MPEIIKIDLSTYIFKYNLEIFDEFEDSNEIIKFTIYHICKTDKLFSDIISHMKSYINAEFIFKGKCVIINGYGYIKNTNWWETPGSDIGEGVLKFEFKNCYYTITKGRKLIRKEKINKILNYEK